MTFSTKQLLQIRRLVSTAISVLEEQRTLCRQEARAAKIDLKAGAFPEGLNEMVKENIDVLYKTADKIDSNVRKMVALQYAVKAEIKQEEQLSALDEKLLMDFEIESRTLSNLFVHPTLLMQTLLLTELISEND